MTEAKREMATAVAEKVIAYLHTLDDLNPCLRRAPEDQLRDLQRDVAAIIGDAVPAEPEQAGKAALGRLHEWFCAAIFVDAGLSLGDASTALAVSRRVLEDFERKLESEQAIQQTIHVAWMPLPSPPTSKEGA
jgi:hypothetical protein